MNGVDRLPAFVYPPVTAHRIAEGIQTVVEPLCYGESEAAGGDGE